MNTTPTDDDRDDYDDYDDYVMDTSPIDLHLDGLYTARTPLSQAAEAASTTPSLVQCPIVQPDGSLVEVLGYSGDAKCSQLRGLMVRQLCKAIGMPLSSDAARQLFGGGRIEQGKLFGLDHAQDVRRALPLLSLLGGRLGSKVLTGKLRVTNAIPVLPRAFHASAEAPPCGSMTSDQESTRGDDGKHEKEAASRALGEPTQRSGGGTDRPADQMSARVDLLAPGAQLHQRIDGDALTISEVGCLTAAWRDFSSSPFIGGPNPLGHGLVDLAWTNSGGQDGREYYVIIKNGRFDCSDYAADCEDCYPGYLYRNKDWIREVLRRI